MVVAVQKIKQKDWAYTLYKSQEGYLLSVVCGGVAMYELNIPLTDDEVRQHLNTDAALDAFATKIRDMPRSYSDRNVQIEEVSLDSPERVPGGGTCQKEGWWVTPAKIGSRRFFNKGDIFPTIEGSAYGATFWQWDKDQSSSK